MCLPILTAKSHRCLEGPFRAKSGSKTEKRGKVDCIGIESAEALERKRLSWTSELEVVGMIAKSELNSSRVS